MVPPLLYVDMDDCPTDNALPYIIQKGSIALWIQ